MLYLISPTLAQSSWDKMFNYSVSFQDIPFSCDIHNLIKLNESFNSCEKKKDQRISILAFRILDRNLTLLPNLIEQSPNTTMVVMNDLNLTSINSEDISKWKHLTRLDVSYNNLKKLPSHLLSGCQTLYELYISDNEIIEIEIETFADISSLIHLVLSSNHIEILNPNLFKPLINLKSLSLDNNRIQTVDPYLFSNNVKLDWLNLSYNNISNVELQMVNKLQQLYISDNPIVNIDLKYIYSLKLLNISNCFLKTLFVPSNILFLYAFNNQISHITTQSNSKLLSLRIGLNKLHDSFDLRSLVNLRVLDLSNNNITNLNFANFLGLNKLLNLQLNSICVKDVNIIEMMKTLPALQQLNISSIYLSTETSMKIQQNARKFEFPIEIYHDEKTNITTLIKNGLVDFDEYLNPWMQI